jgi:hypothetical protein
LDLVVSVSTVLTKERSNDDLSEEGDFCEEDGC